MGLYSMVDMVTINMYANFHSNIFDTFEVDIKKNLNLGNADADADADEEVTV